MHYGELKQRLTKIKGLLRNLANLLIKGLLKVAFVDKQLRECILRQLSVWKFAIIKCLLYKKLWLNLLRTFRLN